MMPAAPAPRGDDYDPFDDEQRPAVVPVDPAEFLRRPQEIVDPGMRLAEQLKRAWIAAGRPRMSDVGDEVGYNKASISNAGAVRSIPACRPAGISVPSAAAGWRTRMSTTCGTTVWTPPHRRTCPMPIAGRASATRCRGGTGEGSEAARGRPSGRPSAGQPALAYECRPSKNRLTPNRFISIVAKPISAIHVAVVRLTLGVARACR
jgi:hypothetical protein